MSEVILDTITGKSTATTITIGSTPVVSSSANSMTIRGEGTAQTSIQQGLGKAWIRFNGTGTVAINDSFNMASLTDLDTGYYQTNYTTSFNSADTSITISSNRDGGGNVCFQNFLDSATGNNNIFIVKVQNATVDSDRIAETVHGDLA